MSRFRLNDPTMPLTAAIHHPGHHAFSHHHYLPAHPTQSAMYPAMATYHHVHPPQQPPPPTQQQHFEQPHSPETLKSEAMASKKNASKTPSLVASNAPLINLSMAMGLGVGMGLNFGGPANTITKKVLSLQES